MEVQEPMDWSEGFRVRVGDQVLGLAEASPETAGYWEGVQQGELRLKHCQDCGHFLHPRRIVCPGCSSIRLEWKRVSGDGEVYTFSQIYRAPRPELASSVPYCVGIVELEEGVCLFGRLLPEEGAEVRIGAVTKVEFRQMEVGGKLPVWTVSGE